MITIAQGDLLKAPAKALVNAVNCVGIMGNGIAAQFKRAYPENYQLYREQCLAGKVVPGKVYIYLCPGCVINFPTKRHWRDESRIEDIEVGLISLVDLVRALSITSIAIPALGCGEGGLKWNDVRPLIESAFDPLPGVNVLLFEPRPR